MIKQKKRQRNGLWNASMVGSALLAIVALAGCGGGSTGGSNSITLDSTLNGAQEVPPVATAATGNAKVTLNIDTATITVKLNATGLDNVTAIHIHYGAPGTDGPVMFTLYNLATDGPFTGTITKTLTAADFTPVPSAATFTDALGVMRGGGTYINVHTVTHPDGEIRGQINA